jgi:hypothetical protein
MLRKGRVKGEIKKNMEIAEIHNLDWITVHKGSGMPRTEHCCFPLLFLSPLPHRAPPVLALVDLEEEES